MTTPRTTPQILETFAQAIRSGGPAPIPLEDSVKNMAVIDALFCSAESGRWEAPAPAL